MDLKELLQERYEREAYLKRILGALALKYNFVDMDSTSARLSASAGNLLSYLALKLEETNNTSFQIKIKKILIENHIIKSCVSGGRIFYKGLVAKDTTDLAVSDKVLEQHYKDRAAYIERQKQHRANRKTPHEKRL